MGSKCTITFEDPYWVGIFERCDDGQYSAARFVFGAEPGDAELHQFALRVSHTLAFISGCAPALDGKPEAGYKRRQRQVRNLMRQVGAASYAHKVIQAERERLKQDRRRQSREEHLAEEREKFLQKKAVRREKHRGH